MKALFISGGEKIPSRGGGSSGNPLHSEGVGRPRVGMADLVEALFILWGVERPRGGVKDLVEAFFTLKGGKTPWRSEGPSESPLHSWGWEDPVAVEDPMEALSVLGGRKTPSQGRGPGRSPLHPEGREDPMSGLFILGDGETLVRPSPFWGVGGPRADPLHSAVVDEPVWSVSGVLVIGERHPQILSLTVERCSCPPRPAKSDATNTVQAVQSTYKYNQNRVQTQTRSRSERQKQMYEGSDGPRQPTSMSVKEAKRVSRTLEDNQKVRSWGEKQMKFPEMEEGVFILGPVLIIVRKELYWVTDIHTTGSCIVDLDFPATWSRLRSDSHKMLHYSSLVLFSSALPRGFFEESLFLRLGLSQLPISVW